MDKRHPSIRLPGQPAGAPVDVIARTSSGSEVACSEREPEAGDEGGIPSDENLEICMLMD